MDNLIIDDHWENIPPRQRFAQQVGKERTCDTCGETKPISNKTFSISGKEPSGVTKTCKVCTGKKGAAKGLARKALAKANRAKLYGLDPDSKDGYSPGGHPRKLPFPDPVRSPGDYWKTIHQLREDLYSLALEDNPKARKRLEKVKETLTATTRLKDDPNGGGLQDNPLLAFRTFFCLFEPLIPKFVPLGSIHDEIFQAMTVDDEQVLLLATRNSAKSTFARLRCLWEIFRDYSKLVVLISRSESLAKTNLRSIRDFMVRCPLTAYLEPNPECLDSADQLQVPQALGKVGGSPSISSYGITGTLAGNRADYILADDCEAENDTTDTAQDLIDNRIDAVRHLGNPGHKLLVLGTPQVPNISVYGRMIDSGEFKVFKARLFEEEDEGKAQPYLHSLWPQRWSDEQLMARRRRTSRRQWNLHYRLKLFDEGIDKCPLKLRDFILVNHDPYSDQFPRRVRHGGPKVTHIEKFDAGAEDYWCGPAELSEDQARYVATIAAVDPASGIKNRDEVGVTILGITPTGYAVIRTMTGVRGSSANETLLNTAALIHSFYPSVIVIEAKVDSLYPKQLDDILRRRGFNQAKIETVTNSSNKGTRILEQVGVPLAANKVIMLESVVLAPEAGDTVKQIVNAQADIRRLRHDDRIDSLAIALQAAGDRRLLNVDEVNAQETFTQQEIDRLLKLPTRKGGITEDSMEYALLQADNDDKEIIQRRIALAEEDLEVARRRGRRDIHLEGYLDSLRKELSKFSIQFSH